ncbi:MAG: hypothetical protein HIU81_03175 [Acidobacteria bacterium]|nr:hypothetical protein [Acidobacteriota bacterium]
MHVIIRRSLYGALFTGGMLALGAGAASAAEAPNTASYPSGSQIAAPITVPVTINGNALSLLGQGVAAPVAAPAAADPPVAQSGSSTTNLGLLGGLIGNVHVAAPITVPVTIGGNSVAALGNAAAPAPAAAPTATPAPAVTQAAPPAADAATTGTPSGVLDGLLGNVQVAAPITVPVTVGCNSVAVLGGASGTCPSSASAAAPSTPVVQTGGTTAGGGLLGGILGNVGVRVPVTVPVAVGCNSVGVLGSTSNLCPSVAASGTPVTPGTPVNPSTPASPATPQTPATPLGDPTGGTGLVTNLSSSVVPLAASAPSALAATGATTWAPLSVALLLLLAGTGLLLVRRQLAPVNQPIPARSS